MTKTVPADVQRPPSFLPPRPAIFRTPSRQASTPVVAKPPEKNKVEDTGDFVGDFDDPPPAKRRKVESPRLVDEKPISSAQEQEQQSEQQQDNHSLPNVGSRHGPWESPAAFFEDSANSGYLRFDHRPLPSGTAPPLPQPSRPWQQKTLLKGPKKDTKNVSRVRQDVKVPTTPCKLETPIDGPLIHDPSVADFFPWAGNHSEDLLNEQTVKSGQFDKPPQTWNESNTARPTLLNTFKHRFGLQTLSSLYGSMMQLRALNQRVTSGAAFKPPPRVTLTEAKRKAWLGDLANAAVPLRRLSRTIPQGIRGQLLLEQCLTNAVPISRAIWFAKCVGANEIRTLKRKGTSPTFAASAEAKWSKDWTANIQQFIEVLAKECGKQDWRTNISYCLRLTTRLYSENLLDKDSFLDWILNSAETSSVDQLPVWLMILHIHCKDLTRSRRRGGRLATLLLGKLRSVQTSEAPVPNLLVEKLRKFVRDLVVSRPACFLIPQNWYWCEAVLRQCLQPDVDVHQNLIKYLARVNDQASGPMTQPETLATSARKSLIQLLDAAQAPYKVHQLAKECSHACAADGLRLMTTIEWSCTRFRHGEARLYLAVRLLRLWHRNGCNLDGLLHECLANGQAFQCLHAESLHHLITELVRSRDFAVSKYLQWLTARGSLRHCFSQMKPLLTTSDGGSDVEISTQVCDEPAQLLTAIPLLHLPDHVKNLRSSLLYRLGFDVDNESRILLYCKSFIAKQLNGICFEADSLTDQYESQAPDFGRLAWTLKSELGQWLRGIVAGRFPADRKENFLDAVPNDPKFTLDHFVLIRGVLEQLSDLSMLADVLCSASRSRDEAVLASIADSINAHLESLSAIGALDDLHKRISQAYVSLKASRISLPTFAISLLDLGSRHPDVRVPVRVLREDLARGDKINTIAAYSPFSDGMAESLQQAGTNFVEEFEAVILSEPNMTEMTMNQLFSLVVERLKKDGVAPTQEESRDSLCLLLARLRIFRPTHFDRLMAHWAKSILASSDQSAAFLVLALVNFGCLLVSAIVENVQELQTDPSLAQSGHSRRNVARLLYEVFASECLSLEPAQYRLRTAWAHFLASNPLDALACLPVIESEATKLHLAFGLKQTNWVPPLLFAIALRDSQHSPRSLEDSSETRAVLKEALDDLFQRDCPDESNEVSIQDVISMCDDFSLPFCQLKLHFISKNPGSSQHESGIGLVDALFSLAAKDPGPEDDCEPSDTWLALASAVDNRIACQLRERAEQAFFAVNLPLSSGRSGASPLTSHSETSVSRVAIYLDIISKTSWTIPEAGDLSLCSQLNEKLAAVWRALNANNIPIATTPASGSSLNVPPTSMPSLPDIGLLLEYLPLLLRFACLHRGALTAKATSPLAAKLPQQDQSKLLVLLVSIALHPPLSEQKELVSYMFDVVATLVDGISEEARAACARCLKDKMRDPRVNYLFGSMNTLSGHDEAGSTLQLVKEGKGVIGDWKVKQWELLEGGADTSLNLGLFQCRVGNTKGEQL